MIEGVSAGERLSPGTSCEDVVRKAVSLIHTTASAVDEAWRHAMAAVPVASWQVRLNDEVLTEREPHRLFSGASMIKTPLAALFVEDLAAGCRAWDDKVAVTEEMRAPGDGLLRNLDLPRAVTLDKVLMLMIAVSDNTATNALIAAAGGLEAVNERMERAGWSSRVRRWIGGQHVVDDGEDVAGDRGLPSAAGLSWMSIADHQDALARIVALDERTTRAFLVQQDRRALARWVTDSAGLAHKTGTVDRVRHDAGVLLGEHGELWVACFTDGGPQDEFVDHPSCVAMGVAMRETVRALDLAQCLVDHDARAGSWRAPV